ncbi:MAG: AsmA-like C-terminal region-containing protein [Betaproteobacteria bacterium]|nr:AsmA-like C-terminal region-containing protein [Betaproteobacteria bacterium]
MDPNLIYVKTAAGEAALQNRLLLRRQDMRAVLIMIDGKTTVSHLLYRIGHMYPVEVVLMRLEADGLIQTLLAADSIWAHADEVAEEIRSLVARHPQHPEATPPTALKNDSDVSTVHFPVKKPEDIPRRTSKRRHRKSKSPSPLESFLHFLRRALLQPISGRPDSLPREPLEPRTAIRRLARYFLALPVLLLFIVAALFLYNAQTERFESALGSALQQPVHIDNVSLKLLPRLHFSLDTVRIGDHLKVDHIRFAPEILPLLIFQLKSSDLALEGLALNYDNLPGFAAVLSNLNHSGEMGSKLELSRVSVNFSALSLSDLEGNALSSSDNDTLLATLGSEKLNLKFSLLSNKGNNIIEFSGTPLKTPDFPYRIESLSFKGSFHPDSINFDNIRIATSDGILEGNLKVPKGADPELSGQIKFKEIRVEKFARVFGYPNLFEGAASGDFSFTTSGKDWKALFDNLSASGRFEWPQGRLEKFDFGAVPRNRSDVIMSGIPTRFSRMSGGFQAGAQGMHLKNILLSSGPISVEGNMDIGKGGAVDGKLSVSLHVIEQNIIDIPVSLSGTLAKPLIHRDR